MQSLFVCAKYSIRGKTITSNSNIYHLMKIFCLLVFQCAFLYNLFIAIKLYSVVPGISGIFYCTSSVIDTAFFFIGVLIKYCVQLRKYYHGVENPIRPQILTKQINVKELKSFTVYNWTWIVTVNCFCIFFVFSFTFIGIRFFELMSTYASISFDINVVYAFLALKLLEKMLRVQIDKVHNARNTN